MRNLLSTNRHRAFTMVEMIVAISISSALGIAILTTLIFSLKATKKAMQYSQNNRETRFLGEFISRDLRNAKGLALNYNDGTTSFTAGPEIMIIRIPSIDANGLIIDIDNTDDIVVYHPNPSNSTELLRELFPDAASARVADTFTFGEFYENINFDGTYLAQPDAFGAFVVHYQFLVTRNVVGGMGKGAGGEDFSTPVSGSIRLRNKRANR